MASPISKSEGFVRTPDKYPHDAFGADTGGRVRPHTGIDTTPTVPNATNRAVLSGVVTRVGYSQYTGNYVEIRDAAGRYWLTFHQRSNLVKPGAIVAEDAVIGYTGNTGGSGALGASKIGVHNHTSLCATQGAATRLISGQVRARYKNETVAEWAADRGLLDPWPIIRDGDKADAPATNTPEKGFLMALTDEEQQTLFNWVKGLAHGAKVPGTVNDWFPSLNNKLDAISDVAEETRDALLKADSNGFRPIDVIKSHVVGAYSIVSQQAKAQGVELDEDAIAKALIDQGLPGAIVTGIVKR